MRPVPAAGPEDGGGAVPGPGQVGADGRPRVLFLSENNGGHSTMHLGIRAGLAHDDRIVPTFVDVPPPRLLRRAVSVQIPGLARLDLDLASQRGQLATSATARRLLRAAAGTYDVLHVYTQHAALTSRDILRAGPSVVATDAAGHDVARLLPYRRPTVWTERQRGLRERLERPVWDAATLVLTKSEWAARSLREDYGVTPDRLRVVPLGIEVPPTAPARVPHERPTITFVGRSLARKGGLTLLDLFRARWADRFELHLVTKEAVAPTPGVIVHRDFEPGDPRLADLFARTDVLAFPTETDTFGYAALEAMSAAVPVVARRTSALPEIVVDGGTGLLVGAGPEELAAAIEAILGDPERARAMGEAGRRRMLERFDARVTTGALVDVLLEAHERFWAVRP
ncbi:MAG: glycosyltransferase family 4 protein [Actinomycetes bacterium]